MTPQNQLISKREGIGWKGNCYQGFLLPWIPVCCHSNQKCTLLRQELWMRVRSHSLSMLCWVSESTPLTRPSERVKALVYIYKWECALTSSQFNRLTNEAEFWHVKPTWPYKFACKTWKKSTHSFRDKQIATVQQPDSEWGSGILPEFVTCLLTHELKQCGIIFLISSKVSHCWVCQILSFSNRTIIKGDAAIFVKHYLLLGKWAY